MINVPMQLAALAAMPGDRVGYTKEQVAQMLGEVAMGQRARRVLSHLKTVTAVAASAAGTSV